MVSLLFLNFNMYCVFGGLLFFLHSLNTVNPGSDVHSLDRDVHALQGQCPCLRFFACIGTALQVYIEIQIEYIITKLGSKSRLTCMYRQHVHITSRRQCHCDATESQPQ